MNTSEKLIVEISDYDNRWNKLAAEIAKKYLYPTARAAKKDDSAKDQNHPVNPHTGCANKR